ncbi:hypothetical protein ACIPW9_36535 [Streptomyces sp. NPDC090052]|uniref:hypothetical protein n=1 Tax=Streptomyces sp. NPDC090052 TaxID=3365931 RepID=UPI0037FC90A3
MSRTKTRRPRTTRPELHPVPATTPAPLPTRDREFITETAIRAYYVAQLRGLPVRQIRDWTPTASGATTSRGQYGTLTHTPSAPHPFQAGIPCATGTTHTYPIRHGADLRAAEQHAAACTSRHGAPTVLHLADGLHRADTSAADTQKLSTAEIADGLAARAAADDDQPKEHPQP